MKKYNILICCCAIVLFVLLTNWQNSAYNKSAKVSDNENNVFLEANDMTTQPANSDWSEEASNKIPETISDNSANITANIAAEDTATNDISHPDRITYADGFYYEPITDSIKERIYGKSYKEDCTIPYEDLRYLSVLHYDFSGEVRSGEIICNQAIADDLIAIFYELYQNKYEIDKIKLVDEYDADDDLSCADNNSSCFNYRVIAGTSNLSNHAKGLAIDINPFQNPYITYPDGVEVISPKGSEAYANRSSGLEHMITENDLCYQLFTEHGFNWGGHWHSLKDYQHFEKPME